MALIKQTPTVIMPFGIGNNRNAETLFRRIQDKTGMASYPFVRAGVKNVVDDRGILVAVPANKPAVQFDNGVNKGLWIEPSATNLFTQSRSFDNSAWQPSATDITVTPNSSLSIDNTMSMDKVVAGATSSSHAVFQLIDRNDGNYTVSIIAKKAEYDRLLISSFIGSANYTIFNLTTGTVQNTVGARISNAIITPQINGCFKCEITFNFNTGANVVIRGQPASVTDNSAFAGNGTSGMFLDFAQIEKGSVSSSTVVTTTTPVTRPVDVATIRGTNATMRATIAALIGQTAGTIPIRVYARNYGTGRTIATIGTLADGIHIFQTGLTVSARFNSGGVERDTLTGTLQAGFNGIVVRYDGTAVSLHVNGVQVDTGTATDWAPATMDEFSIGCDSNGANQYGDFIRIYQDFKQQLTATEANSLSYEQ